MQTTPPPSYAPPRPSEPRLQIDVHFSPESDSSMVEEIAAGLESKPRVIHPKYLYDDVGSRLFDQICDTPEYYPTRTEHKLLKRIAPELLEALRPDEIVELGSGACHKTRCLLDAAGQSMRQCTYTPVDVSEAMLRQAAEGLLESYPWLRVRGLVADYTKPLKLHGAEGPRLFVFIGSTIGNFTPHAATDFLKGVARLMTPEDRLMLGTDLVKDSAVLNAAYNDSQGLTAQFNCNVLQRLNRDVDTNFSQDGFQHEARFVEQSSQVEMRLRSVRSQSVTIGSVEVAFEAGETILTEISRKFTRNSATALLASAGLRLEQWHSSGDDYFGVSIARLTEN